MRQPVHLISVVLFILIATFGGVMTSFETVTKAVTGFNDVKLVAEGAYGKVYRAQDGDSEVAVKAICLHGHSNTLLKGDITEIMVHRCLQGGPNIVDFIHAFSDDNYIWIVMKMYPCSLSQRLNSPLENETARRLAEGILQGVAYMHAKGLVHCDLKPDNILIDTDGTAKIADFGLTMPVEMAEAGDHIVTRFYRAPELVCLLPWGRPVDLWSVGCILFEILAQTGTGVKQPNYLFTSQGSVLSDFEGGFDKTDLHSILQVVGTLQAPYVSLNSYAATPVQREFYTAWRELPPHVGVLEERYPPRNSIPAEAKDLVARLLDIHPERRWTAAQALHAPYFQETDHVISEEVPGMSNEEAERFARVKYMQAEEPYRSFLAKRYKFDHEQRLQTQLKKVLNDLTTV